MSERFQLAELYRDAKESKLADIAGEVPFLEAVIDEKENYNIRNHLPQFEHWTLVTTMQIQNQLSYAHAISYQLFAISYQLFIKFAYSLKETA